MRSRGLVRTTTSTTDWFVDWSTPLNLPAVKWGGPALTKWIKRFIIAHLISMDHILPTPFCGSTGSCNRYLMTIRYHVSKLPISPLIHVNTTIAQICPEWSMTIETPQVFAYIFSASGFDFDWPYFCDPTNLKCISSFSWNVCSPRTHVGKHELEKRQYRQHRYMYIQLYTHTFVIWTQAISLR